MKVDSFLAYVVVDCQRVVVLQVLVHRTFVPDWQTMKIHLSAYPPLAEGSSHVFFALPTTLNFRTFVAGSCFFVRVQSRVINFFSLVQNLFTALK